MATRSKHAQRSKRSNKKHEAMLNVFAQISGRYAYGVTENKKYRQEIATLGNDRKDLRRSKVLSVIDTEEQNKGYARISLEKIAKSSCTSKRHVMDAVNELVDARQLKIVVKGAGNSASLYKTLKEKGENHNEQTKQTKRFRD